MIRHLSKYIYEMLLPKRMKEAVDIFKYLRMESVDGITETTVLILAPHPDDETIGCGGTIQAYRRCNAHITCVFMTDGRQGNPGYDKKKLIAVRQQEAEKAGHVLGIDRLIFLGNRDGELTVNQETVNQLFNILEEIRPDAVFLPFFSDNHPDHRATCMIFLAALRKIKINPMCYTWGVWTPLPYYNVTVDITGYIDLKKEALEMYQSEIGRFDLVGGALSLSKYYYVNCGGHEKNGWTEVFLAFPGKEFIRMGAILA